MLGDFLHATITGKAEIWHLRPSESPGWTDYPSIHLATQQILIEFPLW